MNSFAYEALPGRVLFGAGTRERLGDEIKRLNCARALVLSTPRQQDTANEVARSIGPLAAGIFTEAVMHTPVPVSERAVKVAQSLRADCTVAVGGGSTTGLGKAIALRTDLSQIVIPTTYAGSEMTPILGETADGVKTTQRMLRVLPEVVLYDVELTLALPVAVSVASGFNAVAHAVEALYAKERNPLVSLIAEESLRAFARSLGAIVENPNDVNARADALHGAWLAGTCLGAVGMALHHKLCHVLGGTFDLPHAETHAIVLPHAIAYNAPLEPVVMRKIAEAFGTEDPAIGIYELAGRLGAKRSLKEVGLAEAGIERAVKLATQNPYWNPRKVEAGPIRQLLQRAWSGEPPAP
jgi:maleylacetate reductase